MISVQSLELSLPKTQKKGMFGELSKVLDESQIDLQSDSRLVAGSVRDSVKQSPA